jgi:Zn-dependent M16 (insulinase) family peptidase
VLNRFDNSKAAEILSSSEIPIEDRFKQTVIKDELFMPDLMSESETQAKYGISYLCNKVSDDPYETFCMNILSTLLFEGPNSPFYKKIIEEGVAPNFCPGTGYDHTTKEATFTMGV